MKKTKSKNKFLLTTSLSVVMGMTSFAAMAQTSTSMEQKDKLAKTVEVINAEVNTEFPKTDNKDAIYPSNKDSRFRVENDNENFKFYRGKEVINIDPDDKFANINFAGYKIKSDDVTSNGFIVGKKEVENSGNPKAKESTEGRFFKYWNPNATSIDERTKKYIDDGQFSPSYPKLCYYIKNKEMTPYSTEIKTDKDGKIIHPLIRLAVVGEDSKKINKDKMYYYNNLLKLPVVPLTTYDLLDYAKTNKWKDADFYGLTFKELTSYQDFLDCNPEEGCYFDWVDGCYKIKIYGDKVNDFKVDPTDPVKGFNFINNEAVTLVNCSSGTSGACPSTQVQSFRRNNSNEPYRTSQWVKLDIDGNIEPIEVPQQTCYNCVNIGDAIDATCEHIVDEVFKEKNGDCQETVKALATNPRAVKSWLPTTLNTQFNCTSCLCKIEDLLKAKGCQ